MIDDAAIDNSLREDVKVEQEQINEKLKIVERWSRLSHSAILNLANNNKVSEITTQCKDSTKLFDHQKPDNKITISIGRDDASDFQSAIRPYIGSTKGTRALKWPLVEIVHIYVEADVLRNGIVLVDLPGEQDAVESRAKVAKDYQNKVDLTMIVAPGDRLVDDQTAMEHLRDDQLVDFEASGKMESGGVCLIATKIDDFEWESFLNEGFEVEDISPEMPRLTKEFKAKKEEKRLFNNRSSDQHSDEARRIQQEFEAINEKCLRVCLDSRNRDIQDMFVESYQERTRSLLGDQYSIHSPTIAVFPVSSRAYRALQEGDSKPAFRDEESTGFHDLIKFINHRSLPARKVHADFMLAECQGLFVKIEDWAVKEWLVELRLSPCELIDIKSIIERHQKVLEEVNVMGRHSLNRPS